MNNQLWIFVAVAGVAAVVALWEGWLWVRKKVRLSEQFQRDVREEIDSLRQHIETLEEKELDSVRQQVESLAVRQSHEESGRLEETSRLRTRLDRVISDFRAQLDRAILDFHAQMEGLSTKESEMHMQEMLGDVYQEVKILQGRQSEGESRWSEEIPDLRARLDGLKMISEHRVCLPEKSDITKVRDLLATAFDLKEGDEEYPKMLFREFSWGNVQMQEIEDHHRKEIVMKVRSKEETDDSLDEIEEQVDRLFGEICQLSPDAESGSQAYSHHFLHGETGGEVLLSRICRQNRDRSLVVLAQHGDTKWRTSDVLNLCEKLANEVTVIKLDHPASVCLARTLDKGRSRFGAIRVYGPGWDQDNPEMHRVFLWKDLGKKVFEGTISSQELVDIIRARLPKDSVIPDSERESEDAARPPVKDSLTAKEPTVQERVEQAKRNFKGLLFGDDVDRGVSGLDPRGAAPKKVYLHLSVLNDLADKLRRDEPLGCTEMTWLRKKGCRASGESKTTINKGLRKLQVGALQVEFPKRTKPKDSTHPDKCVRIHYEWGETLIKKLSIGGELGEQMRGRIFIAWVGRHL